MGCITISTTITETSKPIAIRFRVIVCNVYLCTESISQVGAQCLHDALCRYRYRTVVWYWSV